MAKTATPKKPEILDAPNLNMQMIAPPSLLKASPLPAAAQAFLAEAQGERQQVTKVPFVIIDHEEGKFVLPSGELVDSIEGYCISWFQTRRFYQKAYRPGDKGTPPDCWSPDLITPSPSSPDPQAKTCAACPLSQFGSGRDGRGQACSVQTWMFLLNPTFGTPPISVVIAPPSSIRNLMGTKFSGGFFSQAAAKGGVFEIVWGIFNLERAAEGSKHVVVAPSLGPVATDMAEVKAISAYRNQFLQVFAEYRGSTPEVSEPAGEQEE